MLKDQGKVLYFQQYFQKDEPPDENSLEERSAEAFYELANAPVVGFKIESSKRGKEIRIHQDSECQTHTGGIVWETSYLLACYLEAKHKNKKNSLGKVLEVGSGCGMLGLILSASKLAKNVVMTETTEVLPNLEENVSFNLKQKGQKKRGGHDREQYTFPCCTNKKISVRSLRWDELDQDIKNCQEDGSNDLEPHSFDTIIGTDVIFSTRLVNPLLESLQRMSHERTKVYLCVQVRCADSHAMFLKEASKYGLAVSDCTDELNDVGQLKWGLALDCKLLSLSVIIEKGGESSRTRKKRKRENR